MTFISIIIPFNKSKRYLKDCLSSLYEQNLSDEEIILIVNGCDENIDDLLEDYPNIVVKYFKNPLTVSKARNEGLKLSNGKYVYFIDSDDYIYEDGLSKLIEVAKSMKADFINGERIETYYIKNRFPAQFDTQNTKITKKNKLSDEEFSMKLLTGPNIRRLEVLSALHCLIKKERIQDLFFKNDKKFNCDYDFMIPALNNCKNFIGVENSIYAKRISDDIINEPSLNQQLDEEVLNYIEEYENAKNKLNSDILKQQMSDKIYNYYHNESMDFNEILDIAYDFNLKHHNFFEKIEIKALKSRNKKTLKLLKKFKLNSKKLSKLLNQHWRLKTLIYFRFFNKKPINPNMILFESFSGNYYSDNPKYIYEYLYENYGDEYEYVWVINDKNTEIPGNPIKVKRYSLKYYKYIALSKYWVINTRQPERLAKKDDQIIISTWHGTPLKRLGFDMGNIYLNNPRTKETYMKNSAEWDYFISQNAFSSEVLKRSFAYPGEMLEIGYPRNDVLYNADKDFINQIKKKLNLPMNKKIILYAPTWRDDDSYGTAKVKFKIKLELDKLKQSIGDEYVVLVRNHYLVTDSDVSDYKDFAYDVTKYEDIGELYLISDLLITDYSSVFFDFANLKKPILFYTYDLDKYEQELRGFYIDIHTEVPGPLLKTTEEVIEAILNIEEISKKYYEKYEEFYNRFCYIDDGNASKRLVEKVWLK